MRSAAHHKSGIRAKVKALRGLNPDKHASHSRDMHQVCHTLKIKEVLDITTVCTEFNLDDFKEQFNVLATICLFCFLRGGQLA